MDEQQEETDEVEEVQMQQQKEPGQHTIIIRPTAHGRSVIYENERGMGVERPAPKLAGNEEEQRHRKTSIFLPDRQAIYKTRRHNHGHGPFAPLARLRPLEEFGLVKPNDDQHEGNFDMGSLAMDVKELAGQLGLEFKQERCRFILLKRSDGEQTEDDTTSTSPSERMGSSLKWLVLRNLQKQGWIKCSEYSRREGAEEKTIAGGKERWRKWGQEQFLRAIRSKSISYFFRNLRCERSNSLEQTTFIVEQDPIEQDGNDADRNTMDTPELTSMSTVVDRFNRSDLDQSHFNRL